MSEHTPAPLPLSDPAAQAQIQPLLEYLRGLQSVAVCFSGGVDSSFLAWVTHQALGERCAALTAISPSTPAGEADHARQCADLIGIRHEFVPTSECEHPDYLRNLPERCYVCKRIILQTLAERAHSLGLSEIVEGSNADDLGADRPGMQAVRELGVHSPLLECGLTKARIRSLAQAVGLPCWDKPSSPCLATRIPTGTPITAADMERVDRCEAWLRSQGLRQVRVRCHGELARIEVPPTDMPRLLPREIRQLLLEKCRENGFRHVALDLAGYAAS